MLKLNRADSNGNIQNDDSKFEVLLSGLDIFKVDKMPDGSNIVTIEDKKLYNSLTLGPYRL